MKQSIGQRIKLYREFRQLSQAKLAELAGLSEVSIRMYELGQRNPKAKQLNSIAKALHINVSVFYDLDITTRGDVAALLFNLANSVDLSLVDHDGRTAIVFDNSQINSFLREWSDMTNALNKIENEIEKESNPEGKAYAIARSKELKQAFELREMDSRFVVSKGTDGISIKM